MHTCESGWGRTNVIYLLNGHRIHTFSVFMHHGGSKYLYSEGINLRPSIKWHSYEIAFGGEFCVLGNATCAEYFES